VEAGTFYYGYNKNMTRDELEAMSLDDVAELLPVDIYGARYGLRIKPSLLKKKKQGWAVRYVGRVEKQQDVKLKHRYTVCYEFKAKKLRHAVIAMLLHLDRQGVLNKKWDKKKRKSRGAGYN
jgi:hypothetical protein